MEQLESKYQEIKNLFEEFDKQNERVHTGIKRARMQARVVSRKISAALKEYRKVSISLEK